MFFHKLRYLLFADLGFQRALQSLIDGHKFRHAGIARPVLGHKLQVHLRPGMFLYPLVYDRLGCLIGLRVHLILDPVDVLR